MPVDFERIRELRVGRDLTQEQAAQRAKMTSKQAWNNVESGRQVPTIETLERIAIALGVKAKDLLK